MQGTVADTDEQVAVKCCVDADEEYIAPYITREAKTMSLVRHPNIVKFLAIENIKDIVQTRRAIIMEYCENGSLQNMLAENPNGLQHDEFFNCARQLVAGVEHLVQNRIAHRDLKPDNVMVSKCSHGSLCYKIGDFGAARQLQRQEKYKSLWGTHEYLHVNLYEQYYYKLLDIKPKVHEFDYTHDFWSLGVTLYETATGKLPFEPAKGRDDKSTMYRMISEKESDHIAANQTNNGIEWLKSLPETSSVAGCESVTQHLAKLINVSENCS